jgi:DNA-binding CsgD family transcriptional regulator
MLDLAMSRVRSNESAVLVIRGEAGIGKTALLDYCHRRAAPCRLARIAGVQSELELPFAALHQLCRPMLGGLAVLPGPQKQALQIAFGLATGPPPDRFLVGLATLGVLAEAASEEGLICLVDDAQWLDEATAQVLGFVGRRLLAESILLVLAVREVRDTPLFPDLPDLTLKGLADEDARALVSEVTLGRIDTRVLDRLVAEAQGNPLALIELPKEMDRSELAGGFRRPTMTTVPDHIEQTYLRRISALPEDTRTLLLLAAADPTGDASLLWRAAGTLSLDPAAGAEAGHLVDIGSSVRFRHPLVRSAAYAAAKTADRTAAHLALAEAAEQGNDPERRVWHLAAAATGPDEGLAAELEQTARTAQARAGLPAAAAFLERAALLTVDPLARANRSLAAAQAHMHAGSLDAARALLAQASAIAVNDLQRARVEQLHGQLEAATNHGSEAPLRLLHAAQRLESLDARFARDTYLQAWWSAVFAGSLAVAEGNLSEVSKATLAAPKVANPSLADRLLDGLARLITDGRTVAAPSLREAVELCTRQASSEDWLQYGRSASTAAFTLWDADSWTLLSTRQVARIRESGALTQLVVALNFHAFVTTLCGDFVAATALLGEHEAAMEATGIRVDPWAARMLAAYRGRSADLSPNDRELIEHANGYALEIHTWASAVLNNGLGRYGNAVASAQEIVHGFSFAAPHRLSELIEAEVRQGRTKEAETALQQLLPLTVAGSDWSAGIEARARALISAGEAADHWYTESIECLARTPLRPELARSQLVYGEWLRRENRRVEARDQLRVAHDSLVVMGADGFAERARRELVATGEHVRKRSATPSLELTPQEAHIARLARDGRSNPEIAAELFLSTRTVEWHLRKVFTKLGIASRRELKDVLR